MKQSYDVAFLLYVCVAALATCGSGCCKDCPPPKVGPPTVVEVPCELPPLPKLPVAKTVAACAPKLICFDVAGAVAIAERDGMLRQWVKEVNARCRRKPTTRPAETTDAGSTHQ